MFQVEDKGLLYYIYGGVCEKEKRETYFFEAEEGHLQAKHRTCSCELQSGTSQNGPGLGSSLDWEQRGKNAVFPKAMVKESGEWAKFRMKETVQLFVGHFYCSKYKVTGREKKESVRETD